MERSIPICGARARRHQRVLAFSSESPSACASSRVSPDTVTPPSAWRSDTLAQWRWYLTLTACRSPMETSLDRNAKLSLKTFAFTAAALAARGCRTANSKDASPVRLALKMGSACEGRSGALCCAFGGVFGMAVNGWWPRYDIVSWKKASRNGQEDIAVQQAFRTLGHRSATRRRATMSLRNNRQSRLDRQVLLWQGSGRQISGLLRRPSNDQRQTFENPRQRRC